MDISPNLNLPYILAAQAQKHVTHNEAVLALDCLVQISVADRDLTAPPAGPIEGQRFIVAANPSGAWAGKAKAIAAFQDGAWLFYTPKEGWLAWVGDEDKLVVFDGSAWILAASGGGSGAVSVNPAPLVGVNTTADATNRLSAKSDAVLLSHDDVTPGSGDMRLKLNKSAAAKTSSLLFQSAFSGRAEFGTTGDDNFHVKVSADGAVWREAMVVDRTTGLVSFPSGATGVTGSTALAGFVDVVRQYAVDVTGATNVATALQAALTAISGAGLTAFLPSGIYELGSATITVPTNAIVMCAGGTVVRRSADPAIAAPMISLSNGAQWINGELRHSGTGAVVALADNCAIRALSVTGAAMRNIRVSSANTKWQVGIMMQNATRCVAEGCHVSGVANRAYYAYLAATDLEFRSCSVEGGTVTAYGFNINPAGSGVAQNILIANCAVNNTSAQGFEFGDQTYDSRIVNCRANSVNNTGFLIQKANGFFPQFNMINGCAASNCRVYGFQISETFYNQMNGCSAKSCGTGLFFNGSAQLNSITGFRSDSGSTAGAQPGHGVRFGDGATRNDVLGLACIGNAGTGVLFDPLAQLNRAVGRSFNNAGGNLSDLNTGNIKDVLTT